MTIEYTEIQEFAKGCVESYQKNSILRDISSVVDFEERSHQDTDFLGIGKRINLPKEFFSDPSTLTVGIESDVGRAAFKGERNFILKRIRNKATNGQLDNYSIDKFDYESISEVLEGREFTHLFLPLRAENDESSIEWMHKSSSIYFQNGNMYIDRNIQDVRVHILPSNTEFGSNRAFALNNNRIEVIQKKKGEANDPTGMELIDEFRDVGIDEHLMLYFGQHPEYPDEFDFLYRVLLSEPKIGPNGAAAIHVPVSE